MPSILFVCTGNQYRSPIAAAAFWKELVRRGVNQEWLVASAGTWTLPDLPAHPKAVQMARRLGLEIANRRTCVVNAAELANYDLVLVMEQGHKEALQCEFPQACGKVYLLSDVVDQIRCDVPDPADPHVDAVKAAGLLYGMIERGSSKIIELVEALAAEAGT